MKTAIDTSVRGRRHVLLERSAPASRIKIVTNVSWSVFSLLHDDAGRPIVRRSRVRAALAGAVVWDLRSRGLVGLLEDPTPRWRIVRVRSFGSGPTGRAIEDLALLELGVREQMRATKLLGILVPRVYDAISGEMLARKAGLAEAAALKKRLEQVLSTELAPVSSRDAAVIALVWAAGASHKVFPFVDGRQLGRWVAKREPKDWITAATVRKIYGSARRWIFGIFDFLMSGLDLF